MRVRRLRIQNFRGIAEGNIDFDGHTLLVGGNNAGKSTVCEALDLVLGPERLYRQPVVDEHDFHKGCYIDEESNPIDIRIEAFLVDLSEEAERRFHGNLRRWNDKKGCFADETGDGPDAGDEEGTCWALPILFIGRYDPKEDDFIGNTFFAHPVDSLENEEDEIKLGAGLRIFTREHKRLCGFVFLRTLRTGSRALSLQRGSLLDTVLRLGRSGLNEMWLDTLKKLCDLEPAIGEIEQLKQIRSEVKARMARFVNLAAGDNATAFFASDLTRDHLREVVRFFVASEQSEYLVPFQRLGTGSINMLVFALLTFIADLKDKRAVIFAMEGPEIALPPHTQRRVTRFVLGEMGQAIVTSHSPYVIEQFEPRQIVILDREKQGKITGRMIDIRGIKPKTFKTERRQFAETILSRAVLVIEGSTEAALFPAASTVLELTLGPDQYVHLDLAGVSIFNAGGDGSVPRYGPIFKALRKLVFGFYDKPNSLPKADAVAKLGDYTQYWESPHKGIENLLVEEMKASTLRLFLDHMKNRSDYPDHLRKPSTSMTDDEVKELARSVLKERKGDAHGYATLLLEHCTSADELPATIRVILEAINQALAPPVPEPEKTAESAPEDQIESVRGRREVENAPKGDAA